MKVLILFFLTQLAFAQGQDNGVLENKIYTAIDVFVVHPNEENLRKLENQEQHFKAKTKPEFLALVILNCNKAYYENQFGQTNKAIASYEKAWMCYQKNKLSNYDISEFCLKPLGNLYTVIGDYENAENTIKQYFYIANSDGNRQQKYAAILNLSNVYQNSGKINEAINLLEQTLKTEKLTSVQKGILYNNLGNNYFLVTKSNSFINVNYFQKGEDAYKKAISLLKSEKNQSESLSNSYRNLAKRYVVTHQFELAKTNMQLARIEFLKTTKQEPRKTAQFYLDEATIVLKQDSLVQSQKRILIVFKTLIPNYDPKKILPSENSLFAETTLLDALDLQAELFLKLNQPKKALQSYGLAFHIEALFQSMLLYENSKIISQLRNRNRTEKCISIYYDLFQKEKKVNYIETAFVLQEETKAAVLQEYISNSKNISRDERLIREQLQNWNTIIVKEQQKLELADISKINEAIKNQNELMLLLKSETLNDTKTAKREFRLKNLYSKLEKDNAILVEYFYGSDYIYIFTLKDGKITLQNKNNGDIATPILVQFIDLFTASETISNTPKQYNEFSNAAYTLLKLPKKSKHKNLIIIPDGVLTMLPFEALITEKSKTTNFAKMHYLLNDFRVGYNNSAAFYLNSIPFQHHKESILGVFPIFEKSNAELAFSKKELEFLRSNFKGNYLERDQATFGNFRQNISDYSILHLSTHATSGDIYEPAAIRFYDREVLYSEFYNLSINPDLVVLSACETGIGKLYKSEGTMSIARGFQFAGAQNLLFSLWKVNDYTTSVFMEKFYQNIKKGTSYFDSNHQAKLDFIADETIPNSKKSPYYWSSFVYYGTLENKGSGTNFIPILATIIVLIGLFLLFKITRNGRFSKNPKEKQVQKNSI